MDTSTTRRLLTQKLAAIGLVTSLTWPAGAAEEDQSLSTDQTGDDWPTARNTGVSADTPLELRTGNVVVDTPNSVLRALDIRGTVTVKAPGVTIEHCRLTSEHTWDWFVILTAGDTIVRNCTIDGGNVNAGQNAINGGGRFTGNDIFNTENGIAPGSNTVIEGNYIHDLKAPGSPHYDGIQMDGGQSNVAIRRNTIINRWSQTSAIMINNWAGPIANIEIENNLLVGGAYTLYVDGRSGKNSISDVTVRNNHFGGARYGPVYFSKSKPVFIDNVFDGTAIIQSMGLLR